MKQRFTDRAQAGRALATKLEGYAHRDDVLVLALPRGGVPVAFEVARALGAVLDVFPVRKLGAPGHAELAMGAIAADGTVVLNGEVIDSFHVSPEQIAAAVAEERAELERRACLYREDRPALRITGKTVILIDDGLATGSTMRAAVNAVREQKPGRLVVAVPVGTPETCREFQKLADDCVCAIAPENLRAVGLWYEDFTQTTDDEVRRLLQQANEAPAQIQGEDQ